MNEELLLGGMAVVVGIYAGHLRWKVSSLKERLEDAEDLLRSYDAFIFVAKTDMKHSSAVRYASNQLNNYKTRWGNAK